LNTHDFYYDLPEHYIAQTPVEPRDSSKLLVYDREADAVSHRVFRDIKEYLKAGDVLVINNTKVIPARLFGKKREGGREVEFLLLKKLELDVWEIIMRPGKKLRIGDFVDFSDKLCAEILEKGEDGVSKVRFHCDGVFEAVLDELGQMPLPPYITERLADKSRYQTVYAKQEGSAAAPTAGLHFTPQLMEEVKAMGVEIVEVMLHVGLGTFRPVKVDDVKDHKMHSEFFTVSEEAARRVNEARAKGGRIFAVGTTSVRTLESASTEDGILHAMSGNTEIFIYPGYKFKCVDKLITNFHLPESTLVMLVAALTGREKILGLYETAKEENYRFFSFGDAMMIL